MLKGEQEKNRQTKETVTEGPSSRLNTSASLQSQKVITPVRLAVGPEATTVRPRASGPAKKGPEVGLRGSPTSDKRFAATAKVRPKLQVLRRPSGPVSEAIFTLAPTTRLFGCKVSEAPSREKASPSPIAEQRIGNRLQAAFLIALRPSLFRLA